MNPTNERSDTPNTTHRSRWQRFSPSMGWKAFWSEIVIVILGVLIALAANEAVQNWSWQNKVREGEARLKIDVEYAFNVAAETVAVAACVDAQLVAIAANLHKEGSILQPLPTYSDSYYQSYVVRLPDRPFNMPVWDTLIADGTAIRIPESHRKIYQEIQTQLDYMAESNSKVSTAAGRMEVMARPIQLDAGVRKDLLSEIAGVRTTYSGMALAANQLMHYVDSLRLVPKPEQVDRSNQESGTVKFCKAHGYPLADWRSYKTQ